MSRPHQTDRARQQPHDADDLIAEFGLMTDPDYVVVLMTMIDAPARPAIAAWLSELTGADQGDDSQTLTGEAVSGKKIRISSSKLPGTSPGPGRPRTMARRESWPWSLTTCIGMIGGLAFGSWLQPFSGPCPYGLDFWAS